MRRIYPVEVNEGEDRTFELTLTDVNGDVYDLSGCTLASEVRNSNDELVLAMVPTIAGIGVVHLKVEAASSIGKAGTYLWDLKIVSSVGIDYLDASRFRIRKSVTN